MEEAIYRARAYMVDTVPMATLLLDIKRMVVEEAVKRAQESVDGLLHLGRDAGKQ